MNLNFKKALILTVLTLSMFVRPAFADISADQKAALQKQLDELNQQIAQYQNELKTTQSEKNTLANKIKQLQVQQKALQAQIQSTNLLIGNLNSQIDDTQKTIAVTQSKADRLKASMSQTLLMIYEKDRKPLAEALVNDDGLSGFFKEMDNTKQLTDDLSAHVEEQRKIEEQLQVQNNQLQAQNEDAKNLLAIKALQAGELSSKIGEQNTLLSQTKGKEAAYSNLINDKQAEAARIRGQLYPLTGATTQVTFGQAVDIANSVSKLTGVRAAFLLSVLTQESNLGKNVGTCNRKGDPASKSWKAVMKPDRDQEPFKTITSELGLDIDTTPVSCPMFQNGKQVGWGGAMGPAQFIPSTWMGYRAKVTAMTGKPANPWDINDAFIAAAIKLKSQGATAGGDGEWRAAMLYFSGSTNTQFRFYGDQVVARANTYQQQIDQLN